MIKHIVMFRFKESANGADKASNIQKMRSDLEALKGTIEEIKFFEVGVDFVCSDVSYDLVLCSEFESKEDLFNYQKHPEHQKVVSFVKEACHSRVVVDYALP
jgi:hypothetical protein